MQEVSAQGPMPDRSTLASTPSFRWISFDQWPELPEDYEGSPKEIPALGSPRGVDGPARSLAGGDDSGGGGDEDGDDDFEFAVFSRDSEVLEPITADEIFYNGQIRPIYPLFDRALAFDDEELPREETKAVAAAADEREADKHVRRPLGKLMMEDREPPSTSSSASSSESDELEGIPPESYCVWVPRSVPPSPDLRKRSHSTGDSSKRWRLRDLVIGRSHSDGRKKFVFLASPHASAEAAEKTSKKPSGAKSAASPNTAALKDHPPSAAEGKKGNAKGKGRGGGVKVLEMDMVTAHRLYYAKGGAAAPGDRRRSFLPYRKDLVGFFANPNASSRGFQ